MIVLQTMAVIVVVVVIMLVMLMAVMIMAVARLEKLGLEFEDSVKIEGDGSVWIVPLGGDASKPQKIDRLKLASPAGSQVVKGLDGVEAAFA